MKELRSAVNAFFLFAGFLMLRAIFVPGPPGHGSTGERPRFLRMEIEERQGHDHTNRVSISIPHFLVRGGLAMAGVGKLQREMDIHFHEGMEVEELRSLVAELKEKPAGTDVTRERGDEVFRFRRDASMVELTVVNTSAEDETKRPDVVLRLPFRFLEILVDDERPFEVSTLLDELKKAGKGDVIDLKADDAHIRVYLD